MLGKTRIAWVSLFLLGTCLFFACQDDIPGAEDLPPPDAALVAPPTFVGNTLPLRLLQNMSMGFAGRSQPLISMPRRGNSLLDGTATIRFRPS